MKERFIMFYIVHASSGNVVAQNNDFTKVIEHINERMTLDQAFTYTIFFSPDDFDLLQSYVICLGSTLHRDMFERFK